MDPDRIEAYDYHLPPALVAQHPPAARDGGRLMVLPRAGGPLRHATIRDLPALLPAGALLVVNDTRVVPARIRARRPTGGRAEVMLLAPLAGGRWRAMVRSSKGPRPVEALAVEGGAAGERIVVERRDAQGAFVIRLEPPDLHERAGQVPLPPYIKRPPEPADRVRYQTVYAREGASVAAPTAGLHLTASLLAAIRAAGIEMARLRLDVGAGTFRPVRAPRLSAHRMDAESFVVPAATAEAIARARAEGRPVVAVGTTTARALEGSAGAAGHGTTDLFIRPGYRFGVVGGLLTNFHLPRSTLIALVAALAGRERVLSAYREAVRHRYRFYSYGDAMLVI